MKKKFISIICILAMLTACSSTQKNPIIKINEEYSKEELVEIDLLYDYFKEIEISDVNGGKIIVEYYNNSDSYNEICQFSLEDEQIDYIDVGLTKFGLENPGLQSFDLKVMKSVDDEIEYESYLCINDEAVDSMAIDHYENKNINASQEFSLILMHYCMSEISHEINTDISTVEELHEEYAKVNSCICMYYVGD